jgi:EpsI family protein
MHRARRTAVLLAAGMVAASVAGALARPARRRDASLSLEQVIPDRFGAWRIDPVAAAFVRPAGELTRKLYEQLLERTYINERGQRVMLSMALGGDQTGGLELHWPEVCYRFGGFSVRGRHIAQRRSDGKTLDVTRLVAELPGRPEPVTYWAVLGGARVSDSNTFRLRALAHAVRRQVVSGLLVRVSSIDPIDARAFALQDSFIADLESALAPSDRAKVIGLPPQG